ncbi:pilus assembly protein PilP [Neptuniibacter sp. PT8_73]|uniref:pilus assembly protein PilP n=1 Tax=unclassified Neptuniibacter TaxID=2630693 RepID=UPI0039F6BA1F
MNGYKVLTLSFIAFMLGGCVNWVADTADLKKFVAKTNKLKGGSIEALPEVKPYSSFVYEGASMREPFKAVVPVLPAEELNESGEQVSELQPDNDREKDYLESFSIEKLSMVGTINQRDDGRLWALIEDSNSEIHRVTVGDFMGLNHGEIVSLDERQINLLEIIKNGRGGWMKRTRSLALNEPE